MNDYIGSNNARDLVFKTNSGEKMRILSSISSTGALLFVNGGDMVVNGMTVGHGSGASQTNTAIGNSALTYNTTGNANTANGYSALTFNTIGSINTANGVFALSYNTTGSSNTANG